MSSKKDLITIQESVRAQQTNINNNSASPADSKNKPEVAK